MGVEIKKSRYQRGVKIRGYATEMAGRQRRANIRRIGGSKETKTIEGNKCLKMYLKTCPGIKNLLNVYTALSGEELI